MNKNLKFFFIAFLASLPIWWGLNFFQKNLEDYFLAQISAPFEEIVFVKFEKPQKPPLDLNVKSALSLKIYKSGREKILFEKNANEILPIASLTKLMVALIVLENPQDYDFNKEIIISKKAAAQENVPENGNLRVGEKIKIKRLFDFMLIFSSNDSAFALAELIGVDNFVMKMNEKAKILGLNNTHFANSTGLDPLGFSFSEEKKEAFNYSTANDLAILGKYILMEFPLIYELTLENSYYKNFLSKNNIVGGKTGYTNEAGGCLILILSDDVGYIINVILGAPSIKARHEAMQQLIDWLKI